METLEARLLKTLNKLEVREFLKQLVASELNWLVQCTFSELSAVLESRLGSGQNELDVKDHFLVCELRRIQLLLRQESLRLDTRNKERGSASLLFLSLRNTMGRGKDER